MTTEQLFFNGINGSTGKYLMPPLTPEQVAKIAQGEEFDEEHLIELKQKDLQVKGGDPSFRPMEGIDPKNLEETGWGVIFPHNIDPAIKGALSPLLQLRKEQATKNKEDYYKEYTYRSATNSKPAESKNKFLARNTVGPGPANPDKMPYYLLIVGDPETIPYRFQYQLDVQYAVGRICFDTIQEYKQYAQNVVNAETGQISRPRHASFFGVRNSADAATQLSAEHLIKPLSKLMAEDQPDWTVQTLLKEEATKAKLGQLLGGNETPSLLFTASHGMGFDCGDPRQFRHQGALICQDWPGPLQWQKPFPEDFYFSADDVADDAKLLGLIAFHFACYGAGTPKLDEFAHKDAFGTRATIAPNAFVARLPQRLLDRGALAVVGHVERAWGCSFVWERTGAQLAVFQSALKRLMEGHPVGSAMDFFNERYAELSSDLSTTLEDIEYGEEVPHLSLASMWTANNDARSYCVIGDPAVRLVVGDGGGVGEAYASTYRSVTEAVILPKTPSTEDTDVDKDESILKQAESDLINSVKETVTLSTTPSTEDTDVDEDESVLKQAEIDLINSLEQYLEKVKPASTDVNEQLKATVSNVEHLLNQLKPQSE